MNCFRYPYIDAHMMKKTMITAALLIAGVETASSAQSDTTATQTQTTLTAQLVTTSAPASAAPVQQTSAPAVAKAAAAAKVTLPSGLVYQDLVAGTGAEATSDTQVSVHYTLTLDNGTVVDSSRTRTIPKPFKFTPGKGQAISGFEQGVVGMKVGGRRLLTVPAALGYGSKKSGDIPANSTLHFDVELVGIKKL